MKLMSKFIQKDLERFFAEDDLARNLTYALRLPSDNVKCQLKIKDDMILAGLPIFFESFNFLLKENINYEKFLEFEGKKFFKKDNHQIEFELPFNVALTAERIALNLLQKTSSIATQTNKLVEVAKKHNIKILDTRKTTPGHRAFEKYAVEVGGGFNHRLGQSDVWMIKDNHKNFFGGLKNAYDFFKSMHGFYIPVIAEIHSMSELELAIELSIKHIMLDNFEPSEILEAVKIKQNDMTFEVSGGVRLENLEQFCINGVDAISVGSITYDAPAVDLSLKYHR